jgi:hypothetical protein
MKKKLSRAALIIVAVLLVTIGCKKTITYSMAPLTNYYMPLQVGKYITYRLDSLNFYFYGQLDTLTSYLAKDSVEEAITDNQGRPSWLVVRYLSDTTGTLPWTPTMTYMVTYLGNTLQVVENNLRFIKLTEPLTIGFNWTGNTYLPYAPYQDLFDFSDDANLSLGLWNYTYQSVNTPYQAGNKTYDSTVSVLLVNDSVNVPLVDPTTFASRTYWWETYAKNIGLVFRHTELWEYQPSSSNGTTAGYKIGFEVTLTLVDHN